MYYGKQEGKRYNRRNGDAREIRKLRRKQGVRVNGVIKRRGSESVRNWEKEMERRGSEEGSKVCERKL